MTKRDLIVLTSNARDFRKLGAKAPGHPGLAILREAVGQPRQLILGATLANFVDEARAARGRVFEIDGIAAIRHYPLP